MDGSDREARMSRVSCTVGDLPRSRFVCAFGGDVHKDVLYFRTKRRLEEHLLDCHRGPLLVESYARFVDWMSKYVGCHPHGCGIGHDEPVICPDRAALIDHLRTDHQPNELAAWAAAVGATLAGESPG